MNLTLRLWAVVALGAVLAAACGAGGVGAPEESEQTVRSAREYREASVMQQQEQQVEQADQTDAAAVGLAAAVWAEIDFGHRKGLPYSRNLVGDPEAPVLVVEYSDFQ